MRAALSDVERLLSLSREAWRSLGRRLDAIGVNADALNPLLQMSAGHDVLRFPLVKWHLRRISTAAGYAMRMFGFWDPVTPEEARAALGEDLPLERMVETGLLVRSPDGGIVSPLVLRTLGPLHLLCDDLLAGGDAVMGPSGGTRNLIEMAYPRERVPRALDLGCGAGTIALMLAAVCDHVVATDVNPRALTLARVNAWINGVENVEIRRGDLYTPAAGESFDLIASQPPFVSRPANAAPSAYLYGGERGDELLMELLRGLPSHLTPAGLGFVMTESPVIDGEPGFPERARAALGHSCDVLVLQRPRSDIDVHCLQYGKVGQEDSDAVLERAAMSRRDHLERMKVSALQSGYVIVRRRPDATSGWMATVPWNAAFGEDGPSRETVDRLFASQEQSHALAGPAGRAPAAIDRPGGTIATMIAVAEHSSLSGRPQEALALFGYVLEQDATCAAATIGVASLEIARGDADSAMARLAPLVELGDREARRLIGDIQWTRGDLRGAFASYDIEARADPTPPPKVSRCAIETRIEVARQASQRRPFLVWVTCPTFAGSVAGRWFRPDAARRWDLAVNCFAPTPSDDRIGHADHVVLGGPSKLSAVKATLLANPRFFDGYHAILFLDDDVGFRHEDVDRIFWLMARYQLDLAHPSLSDDSACALAPMFHQRESAMRFTNVVDTRAPGFTRAGFVTCVDSFDQAVSGQGLSHVWPHLLADRRRAVGVLDGIVAHHLRPIDPVGGAFYGHLRTLGIDPTQELFRVIQQYGCTISRARTLGDIDYHGRERHWTA
ncbi:MAG TPA: methyltransferase [Polyangiaceae bacterium]|jgi:SAM-dependent methyltransferase